jgi:excinuclease UvrABC helicase subunit UvrB
MERRAGSFRLQAEFVPQGDHARHRGPSAGLGAIRDQVPLGVTGSGKTSRSAVLAAANAQRW